MTRVAVVTGGAAGVGEMVSRYLAGDGHRVAVLDIDADAAQNVAGELTVRGASVIGVSVDVSDPLSVKAAFAEVRRELGPVEILVTGAATSGLTSFDEITFDEWNRYLAVNLTGTFLSVQAALPDMLTAGWGRVVTISAAAGQVGAARQGHYSASQGGIIALTKAVAREYAQSGITANTVPPSTLTAPMLRPVERANRGPLAGLPAKLATTGRDGNGQDIAGICAFLCSEASGFITGQVIGVDGAAVP